jgi:hypothetical protein
MRTRPADAPDPATTTVCTGLLFFDFVISTSPTSVMTTHGGLVYFGSVQGGFLFSGGKHNKKDSGARASKLNVCLFVTPTPSTELKRPIFGRL